MEESYYLAALSWFWENRHKLSKLRKEVMITWLKIMRGEVKMTKMEMAEKALGKFKELQKSRVLTEEEENVFIEGYLACLMRLDIGE